MEMRFLVFLTCLAVILVHTQASPAKSKVEKKDLVDVYEDSAEESSEESKKVESVKKGEELEGEEEEEGEEDLVQEGSHLGWDSDGGDYSSSHEKHSAEDGYNGKAGHDKSHKAGGSNSHLVAGEQGGFKKSLHDHDAHGKLQKHALEDYETKQENAGHHGFKKEGELFDKHGHEQKAKLEKNENIKGQEELTKVGAHGQAGAKVGGEVSKDKGHKHHGFKNVYHKEEYGEHKTFHDEHHETDHKKKYKDDHEGYEHHGNKNYKQHSNKGQFDENKHGSDYHKFGKSGHDSTNEGHFKKGGHHHKVDDGYNNKGGEHKVEAHEQGHHNSGKKNYHGGHHDAGHDHKSKHESLHGHKETSHGHKKHVPHHIPSHHVSHIGYRSHVPAPQIHHIPPVSHISHVPQTPYIPQTPQHYRYIEPEIPSKHHDLHYIKRNGQPSYGGAGSFESQTPGHQMYFTLG